MDDSIPMMASDRLVILHVTAPGRVGGLERVVEALASGHARAGHAVHVVAVIEDASVAQPFLRALGTGGVMAHPVVLPSRAYLRERAAVRALCRRIAPSVVHTHGYRADVATSGVARRLGIPTVTTVHGFTGGSRRNRLYETLQLRAFRRFDAVVAVSRPLAGLLAARGVPERRLRLIVNAWSGDRPIEHRATARARLGLADSGFQVGWLGRLTREKGADVLLEAVPSLPPGSQVSFIGEGRERAALEARAAEIGASTAVRWHGAIDDGGSLLGAFDVFVLSSRTEGTTIVLFEAIAAGVSVVATRVGGVPDVLSDDDALLVSAENPRALAAAIRQVRDDPDAARRRADLARHRLLRCFAAEPWLAEYERLYREIGG